MAERPPSAGSPFDPTTPLSRDATTPQSGSREGTAEHRFAAGDVVAGRYRILRVAGEGGMGVVYEADDLELSERVALKTLHAGSDDRDVARLRREVQLARRVTHPNVCRIYDAGRHEETLFVTMEMLEGETLTSYVASRGRLAASDAAGILRQLCAGLQAAHDAGVIHRDFKSGNVMLVQRGSALRAVITDFGLARTATPAIDALASHAGRIVGTPAYMAPEQIEGADLTPAVDVYALGVVAFEMITGSIPFMDTSLSGLLRRLREPAPAPRDYLADIDPRWEALILRCLERDPKDRFATPAAVAQALDADVPLPRAPKRRNWMPLAAGAAALLLLVAAVAGLMMTRRESAPAPQVQRAQAPRRAVAILGFRNLSPRDEAAWLSTALGEMLATELAAAESLRVIPGEEIARAKRDLDIGDAEPHATDSLAKLGEATGADLVVVGSYVALSDKDLRLDVRVQPAGGREPATAFGATGTQEDLFALVARAGAELRSRLGAPAQLGQGLDLRRAVPVNADAARLFSDGVARMRSFDATGARDALERAIAADPNFALAYGELSDAYALLGDDAKAAETARRGVELSARLPRAERLLLDAKAHHRAHRLDEAIGLYRNLVREFPDDPEHRVRLVTALVERSRGPEALAEVAAMRRLRSVAADARVDLLEAWALEVPSDFPQMLRAADRAIAKARAVRNRDVLAEALLMRGLALSHTAGADDAIGAYDEAEEVFAATGNRAGVAKTLRKRSFVSWRRGDLDGARRLNERALKIYREVGQQLGAASSIGGIGVILNSQGDHGAAREHFIQALEIYRRIGDRQNTTWALSSIAGTYAMQNQLAEALRRYEEALVVARELGDNAQIANTVANIGITHAMNGELARAESRMTEALALYRKLQDRSAIAELEHELGNLAIKKGDLGAARALFERSANAQRELGERGGVASNQYALATIALAEGNPADALAQATAAATEFEAEERTADRIGALTLIVRANAGLGRRAEARAALETARKLVAGAQDPEVAAYLDLETARLDGNLAAIDALIARTEREKLVDVNFDARLALAEAELRAGRPAAARARAASLVADARKRGYGLVVRQASALLR